MKSHSPSFLFLVGLIGGCALLVSYPMWRRIPEEPPKAEPRPTPRRNSTAFQYAPSAPPETAPGDSFGFNEVQVRRQLRRRALMERQRVRKNIVDNPDMPEAVRSRFREELDRLDALAAARPDVAKSVSVAEVPLQVEEDGSFTPEFQEVVRVLKLSGKWDQLSDKYTDDLEDAANNPDLPPEERPSREVIERARSGGYVPVL